MTQQNSGITAVSSLDDPVRGRLYRVVSDSGRPVGRDEAAAAAGIGRSLAAYHLDKLVDLGLLTASFHRPPGRGGPGAGRPMKLYRRSGREFAVTVPPREYELAARLLASAVEADVAGTSRTALRDTARQFGASLGVASRGAGQGAPEQLEAMQATLAEHGFEPRRDESGAVQMRNCPFYSLAMAHRDVVCGMNLAMMEGIVGGLGAHGLRPELDPEPGRCCVVIRTGAGSADPEGAATS